MKNTNTLIRTLAIAGLAITTGLSANAQEDAGLTAAAGIDLTQNYIFRGATVNDDLNVNPTIEASFGKWTVGTWGNFNTDSSQFDEVDYYVGYDVPLGDDVPVGVSFGYTEYIYPTSTDSSTDAEGNTTISGGTEADREVSVGFSLDDVPGSPSLGVYYGIEGPFLDEGLYLELGASHEVAVTEELPVELGVAVGYEAGDNVSDNGFSHATFSAGTAVGPLSIGLNYVLEIDDDVLAVDEEFFITIGAAL